MNILKIFAFILAFLLVINISYAIESQEVQYNIVGSRIVVQSIIKVDQSETLIFPIPEDAETIELYINNVKTEAVIQNNNLDLDLNKNDEIRLSYITEEFIDNTNFLLNFPVLYDTENLKITLVLPEEAVLRKPIKDTTGSIYPRPDTAATDGRSLIFIWERSDLKQGEEISIFAMYKTRINLIPLIIVLVIFIILSFIGYIFYIKKFGSTDRKKSKKEDITEHLKEEEQQIVRILKQRDDQCEQGTLRVVTGFSKAHLSRLLMELESRKIIYKEKRGKKNLIFLK
ncbi:hypothetical protein KY343_04460 [Candidatus Woesearchaeota archaeon]|nr:hypothetical protein [Candidatus Woesearchaeota archaeon]